VELSETPRSDKLCAVSLGHTNDDDDDDDDDDDVALDAISEETGPRRVAQGSAPELDESAAGRAVRYSVSGERRVLLPGAEAITRCERCDACSCRNGGCICVEKTCGRASHS